MSATAYSESTGRAVTGNQTDQPNTAEVTTTHSSTRKQAHTTTGEEKIEERASDVQQPAFKPQSNSCINNKPLTALAIAHYGISTKAPALLSVQKKMTVDTSVPCAQSVPRIEHWLTKASVPSATVTSNTQPTEADGIRAVTGEVHAGRGSGMATDLAVGGESSLTTACSAPSSNMCWEFSQLKVPAVPEFKKGRVDARMFPPSHYYLHKVEIGTWKHESSRDILSAGGARLKAIFSRRKFIYEFEIPKTGIPLAAAFLGFVQMACIEVPFTSITGINITQSQQCEVSIEVNQPPTMFLGRKNLWSVSGNPGEKAPKYDSTPVDLTDGQLMTCPYHKITLNSCKLKKKLSAFDPRFAALLQIPIVVKPDKVLTSSQRPATLPKKRTATPAPKPMKAPKRKKAQESTAGPRSCKCTAGCSSNRCACAKAGGKCLQDCACMVCKNPFNIMEEYGVDVQAAKNDTCLMQNVFKIPDLRTLFRENVLDLPCCDGTVPLSECCVGVYQCPECDCDYCYSWCSGDLCDEESRPRNHCEICKRCGDYRDDHCFSCNKCYFAGCSGFPCPCKDRGRGRAFGGFGSVFGKLF